ncbi:hypothetical protein CHS0354_021025 [Potamilus streckersoni]|uniref:Cyclin A n=1 Tax=Potamilus streckersoni TaxID=2493646 RepID=A0AAE0W029_9BIVA|nr:hypothetical protein CHS0354_021025 [Potamilus streckersoni]
MSNSVFTDHDSENQGPRRVKNIRATFQGATKRTVLGTITNQVRVQPFRAAKGNEQVGQPGENVIARQKTNCLPEDKQHFTIFVDEPSVHELKPAARVPISTLKDVATLKPAVALPSRVPLSSVFLETPDVSIECLESIEEAESPMVLDTSVEIEKKPRDREAIILSVPEYAEDIYAYLRTAELKNRPKPGYMKKQQDITSSMKSILIDWLVEVAEEYKLHRETLFLAVNYIDRFLSQMSVLRGKLQLVGAASMFLAAKYEEIYPPDVGEFAYITDDTYTKKQVLRMEHLILKVLSFDVAVPTVNWFCEDFLKRCDADDILKSLTFFLSELTLMDTDTYLKYIPSVIAASSLCLARFSLHMEPWPESLVRSFGYEVGHFVECLHDLHNTYKQAESSPQQAVMEKYKSLKHNEVSNYQKYPPPLNMPLFS